jgi:hypothetical protein
VWSVAEARTARRAVFRASWRTLRRIGGKKQLATPHPVLIGCPVAPCCAPIGRRFLRSAVVKARFFPTAKDPYSQIAVVPFGDYKSSSKYICIHVRTICTYLLFYYLLINSLFRTSIIIINKMTDRSMRSSPSVLKKPGKVLPLTQSPFHQSSRHE